MASFFRPLVDAPEACELRNARTGVVVATRLRTAFDSRSRRTGLLKDTGLDAGEALIIAPSNAIHTWFMRFAIDVAFVDRAGAVVKIRRALAPWRIAAAWRAFAVVELGAGALEAAGVREGDRLEAVWRSPADQPVFAAGSPASGPVIAS